MTRLSYNIQIYRQQLICRGLLIIYEAHNTLVFETTILFWVPKEVTKMKKQICLEGGWVYKYPNKLNENSIINYGKTFRNEVVVDSVFLTESIISQRTSNRRL